MTFRETNEVKPQGPESQNPNAEADAESPKQSVKRPRMAMTKSLPNPNLYVGLLEGEWSKLAYNEERAKALKGLWRKEAFQVSEETPLDLEIGTGNGYHFAHLVQQNPSRAILGIELKYKPLIQSIRRATRKGETNARILRYDASHLDHLFVENELNNVYIHFPDPWSKQRSWKHRLIQDEFLTLLYSLMKPGSFVDFKTDNLDYFEWSAERFHRSKFKVVRETRDLHNSEWKNENFVTHFEKIFLAQGMKINGARLVKE